MKTYGTVYDLSDLQLAYAPPYGSAKDPINILGYIADDIKDEIYQPFFSSDVDALISENHFFLDVRSKDEYDTGHIKTAVNIPLDELRQRLDEIRVPKNHPVYVNCESGTRSYLAICILKSQGYTNLHNLVGGFSNYRFYKYLPF
jgi:rhodanese-related sulfurtransferase